MIFLVQFGINKHSSKFFRLQIALALQAHAIFCSLWKIRSCSFIPNCTWNHLITYTYHFGIDFLENFKDMIVFYNY